MSSTQFLKSHYGVLSEFFQDVDELDQEKLSPPLRLKYSAISDAAAELGQPVEILGMFVGFQRDLYEGYRATAQAKPGGITR